MTPLRRLEIDFFVEDEAHEMFLRAFIRRLAHEEGIATTLNQYVARGGHGRVLSEFVSYQRMPMVGRGDLLIVLIDANCDGWHEARRKIEEATQPSFRDKLVLGCPDPHIERWYLADPPSLRDTLGVSVTQERTKCDRDRYKRKLADALRSADHVLTLGGIEFASDIVEAMDLYRAAKLDASLKNWIDALRRSLRRGRATAEA